MKKQNKTKHETNTLKKDASERRKILEWRSEMGEITVRKELVNEF